MRRLVDKPSTLKIRRIAVKNKFLDQYNHEVSVTYRGERYLVRDNGAVFRKRRPGKRERPLDNKWTFGNPCDHHGYMTHSNVSVHRVVATAFRGEPPSNDHVVDLYERVPVGTRVVVI